MFKFARETKDKKNMKQLLFTLLFCLPLFVFAQNDDSKYLAGAVPEVNGQVVFQQTFAVKGKTKDEIYKVMNAFVKKLTQEENQLQRTRITEEDPATGTIIARFEEWLVFKKKILYLDRTRFNYLLSVTCSDGKCKMMITQISYYYREDMNGENGDTYKAEEWISDSEAINKAGTKLYPISGKFRKKTIDRVESIFKQAREEFEIEVRKENQATEILSE